MQSELIKELLETMNTRLIGLMFQLVVGGAMVMWFKDMSSKILNYSKLKFSDFGRGTKIEIGGKTGYIIKVGFNEVEIEIDEGATMIVPVDNFVKSNKVIMKHERGSNGS